MRKKIPLRIYLGALLVSLAGMPGFTLAQYSSTEVSDFASLVDLILSAILQPIGVLIIGLTVVYFLWGTSKYVLHGGDAAKRADGQKMMIYGIIALAVEIGLWGLVYIVTGTFGIGFLLPIY